MSAPPFPRSNGAADTTTVYTSQPLDTVSGEAEDQPCVVSIFNDTPNHVMLHWIDHMGVKTVRGRVCRVPCTIPPNNGWVGVWFLSPAPCQE
jgi:hypothetical protein